MPLEDLTSSLYGVVSILLSIDTLPSTKMLNMYVESSFSGF
jgi:hypothetical protein